jgi:hypothetical protein
VILPTTSKHKIGKSFSWPVGAEAVSSIVADVPQASSLVLRFYRADGTWRGFQWLPAVIVAAYRYAGPSISSRGLVDEPWRITIFAVPRKLRHRVRSHLIDDGLPLRVRPWFMGSEIQLGQEGEAEFTLRYDEDSDSLVEERWQKIEPRKGKSRIAGPTDL